MADSFIPLLNIVDLCESDTIPGTQNTAVNKAVDKPCRASILMRSFTMLESGKFYGEKSSWDGREGVSELGRVWSRLLIWKSWSEKASPHI